MNSFKRFMSVVIATSLLMTACGGGDSESQPLSYAARAIEKVQSIDAPNRTAVVAINFASFNATPLSDTNSVRKAFQASAP